MKSWFFFSVDTGSMESFEGISLGHIEGWKNVFYFAAFEKGANAK